MKRKSIDLLRLAAELDSDISILEDLAEKNKRARQRIEGGRAEELDWAALGYTIHNIYNLMESYFLRISKFFENSLDPLSWHKELIRHMTLEIEGLRPALLDRSLAARIDELRSFRHVFRNIYQTELDPKRVELVQRALDSTLSAFKKAHTEFIKKVKAVAEQVEE
jgi:hypothetical protein